jgi:hypothetical protein
VFLTDLEELNEKMGWSRKRQELLEGLEEVLELMASCGVVRVYLDGSFVTDMDRPNDVDGCYDLADDVSAENLDSLGELLTKARIARGLTQAELGKILGMTQQQVQRYEWQKISLWRLVEATDALGLEVNIRAQAPCFEQREAVKSSTVWPWRCFGHMDLIREMLKSAGLSHAI